ncbi:MAG: HEAT repeat domain-containing protein [Deltaproteobacteria bacterium]|nr:HEAT repeat domain-containing protein [Deltaproteobacteria bacterium]
MGARLWARPFEVIVRSDRLPRHIDVALGPRRCPMLPVVTGHREFDDRIARRAVDGASVAAFRQSVRLALLRLGREHSVIVRDGSVTVRTPATRMSDASLSRLVRQAIEVAESLADHEGSEGTEQQHLLHNVLFDASSGARKRSLELLLARHPRSYEARLALERATEDTNAHVRLAAARRLGERGLSIARAIVGWEGESASARVLAFELLAARLDDRAVAPLVDQALESRCPALISAAISRVRKLREVSRLDALVKLAKRASPPVAAAAIRVIGELGDRRFEAALLTLLENQPIAIASAAIQALARIGSGVSISPLSRLAKTTDDQTALALEGAALDALKRIQAREGFTAGRVALIDEDSASGRLSRPERDPSRPGRGEISIVAQNAA